MPPARNEIVEAAERALTNGPEVTFAGRQIRTADQLRGIDQQQRGALLAQLRTRVDQQQHLAVRRFYAFERINEAQPGFLRRAWDVAKWPLGIFTGIALATLGAQYLRGAVNMENLQKLAAWLKTQMGSFGERFGNMTTNVSTWWHNVKEWFYNQAVNYGVVRDPRGQVKGMAKDGEKPGSSAKSGGGMGTEKIPTLAVGESAGETKRGLIEIGTKGPGEKKGGWIELSKPKAMEKTPEKKGEKAPAKEQKKDEKPPEDKGMPKPPVPEKKEKKAL